MPRTPSAFPFSGLLRRRAINPTPPKRVLTWRTALWGQRWCIQWWNTPERTVRHATTAGRERPSTGLKATPQIAVSIFMLRPTRVRMWHKTVFKMSPVAGPKPNATGSSKNASDPVGIPFFGVNRRRAMNPTPPNRVKAWGRPLGARDDVSSGGTHPNELCGTQSQPVESAQNLTSQKPFLYESGAAPHYRVCVNRKL